MFSLIESGIICNVTRVDIFSTIHVTKNIKCLNVIFEQNLLNCEERLQKIIFEEQL